ncbi:CCAAT/enhancer-binding protein zeta isoform X2 [Alligator mississippiensis]|uniref:CCAAT/enhancer-binding protein zeta n=1 Tax=Alligator mississippiensis TaxID=8496 RepID=A0A151MH68_ALLMI|nr:CCAAT/enhancer-binding protein zeta isoform X2 [Alligator mississippiensis]KYO23872.1 CCAAT/enhancer-binding protein zeta [Alligator mississippiensis]
MAAARGAREPDGSEDEALHDSDGDADGFSLREVLRLGGTKQDYFMLAALDETEELVDGGKKGAIDDLEQGELEAFINSLGVSKYSNNFLAVEEEEGGKEKLAKKEKVSKKESGASSLEGKKADQVKEKKGKEQISVGKDGKKKSAPCSEDPVAKKEKQEDIFEFHARQVLLIKPGGKWHDLEYTKEFSSEQENQALVSNYKALAQKLYQHEAEMYKNKTNLQKGSSSAWMKTVVSSGTLGDRMAAMTLLIQDSAVHSFQFVETLVNLIKKKGSRRQSLMALDTCKELLVSDLLPDNRKLYTFSQHPFHKLEKLSSGNRDSRDRRLILWYFEHHLKQLVAEFVQTLESLSHDALVATKARALAVAYELLCNKPEEEKALLVQLVNKLGDPQNKIATKASYLLETLLHKHPNMKGVVCNEVERLLYRSNISVKAQYYAICFLNQVVLSHEESELANKLITLYFCFFRTCIKKKDVESKMLSALLTGVNRAYPYAQIGDEKVKEQMDTLFKVLHLVNFSTSVQALMLLFQVMDSHQTVSDRYYAALYKKLLDPGLALCSKQSMFLNLVYKSLKADVVLRRVKAFVKRLLQVTCGQMPPFICGALYLVSELLKVKPGLRVQLQDHVESDEEECFYDQEEADEEEERFTDADKEIEAERESITEHSVKDPNSATSWVHHQNVGGGKNLHCYDPLHRNPLYCGADRTCLWELKKLSEHFHPSVALFAKTILEGNYIQYSGDPLQDFTVMRFLDRFVYRNPKLHKGKESISSVVMQPKKKQSMNDVRNLAVNSKEFLAHDESKIPVEEVFFYRFYKKFDKEKERRKHQVDEESVEDVDDDEFEKMLDSFEGDNYFDASGQDNLDFAGNVKKQPKGGKKHKGGEESNADWEDSDDQDEFSELDDEVVSLGSMEEDFGEDVDEEGGAFMDVTGDEDVNSEDQIKSVTTKKGKRKKDTDFAGSFEGTKQGKKRKLKDAGMLAAAEEFGYLLDENIGSQFDNIGMNAMANKDNASLKQLKWETERDRWLHNRDVKSIIKKRKQFKYKGLKNKHKSKKSKK